MIRYLIAYAILGGWTAWCCEINGRKGRGTRVHRAFFGAIWPWTWTFIAWSIPSSPQVTATWTTWRGKTRTRTWYR